MRRGQAVQMTALSPFHSGARTRFHTLGESTSIYNTSHTKHITCMCITHISQLSIHIPPMYHMYSHNPHACVHVCARTHALTLRPHSQICIPHSTLRSIHHSQVCPPRCLSSMNCFPEPSQPSGGGIPQDSSSLPREETTGTSVIHSLGGHNP